MTESDNRYFFVDFFQAFRGVKNGLFLAEYILNVG